MNARQIQFIDVGCAVLKDVTVGDAPGPHDVLIRTAYTAISNGTERANLMGNHNVAGAQKYDPSVPIFPRVLGYSESGVVMAVGSEVKSVAVGDRVAASSGIHQSVLCLNEGRLKKIPDNMGLDVASLTRIATFPMAAVRKARLEIGESAIVMGLGILGMIAVMYLRVAGATPVIAADPNPARRAEALANGADYALDPMKPDFADEVKRLTCGGVRVAIEVTGVGQALDQVLDCMARFGRVSLLGCTRDPNFTIDYYRKIHSPGITLIGAHTMARPNTESAPGWWTEGDDMEAFIRLTAMGRLDPTRLIHEVHTPEEAPDVFNRLAYDKNFPFGVLFRWTDDLR